MFQNLALFPSSGKETPNPVNPLDQDTLSLGTKEAVNVLTHCGMEFFLYIYHTSLIQSKIKFF
jgi:hypothetical protein